MSSVTAIGTRTPSVASVVSTTPSPSES